MKEHTRKKTIYKQGPGQLSLQRGTKTGNQAYYTGPIYKLHEMSVDSEFTDLVLFLIKNKMSVNLFYKHFV